ncbi:MAG: VWA domain-containing protein [Sterolibacterium sp.]
MNAPATTTTPNLNNLELNKGDNFIFGVDVSASMGHTDCPGNTSRIEYLKEKVIAFANEAAKWDEDGIDVLAFGSKITPYTGVTAEKAAEVIGALKANEGSTDTAALIRAAYKLHKDGNKEQTVLFVATDGAPNDKEAVKQAIIDITNDVKDEREFNISFLTVGVIDPSLRDFLTTLDDDLTGAKYDIVDVKALDEVDFMSAFEGALND